MSETSFKTTVEWNNLPWQKLERRVFKLQKRIYKASLRGDVKAVRTLQKTLTKSWSAKCIAVRKVTQDNRGRKTAGIDGVKSLTPRQRFSLVNSLKISTKASPTRRVWIPKPGKDEKRPLGIPTIKDRALQALLKMALEPEWEAKFEPNSYGFRPGRSCQDAIEQIHKATHHRPKHILDADIASCFDRINHNKLLQKLNTYPTMRRQIRAWLKAGVMDGFDFKETEAGTPQGGVISPLLANIALHGLEEYVKNAFPRQSIPLGKINGKYKYIDVPPPNVIRYADDFVILTETLETIENCKAKVSEWLNDIGLELKPSKTRIAHTLNQIEGQKPGFDFLGFTLRQFKVGKNQSGKSSSGKSLLGIKTITVPSKESIKRHYEELARIVDEHANAPQSALIGKLSPVIRGWANYYSSGSSSDIFVKLDHLLTKKLLAWAKHRHPQKSTNWVIRKYWGSIDNDNWVFMDKNNKQQCWLWKHSKTRIVRHEKVIGTASPYDGNFVYWSKRMGKDPNAPIRIARLLKAQKGKCPQCRLHFREDDVLEIDHITPRILGGKSEYSNLQLLHGHCHDKKSARDGSGAGTHTKSHVIEEPDEAKVSRPVLKTSHSGDRLA
jgi:RNA-directed DNA polymerase